MIKEIFIILPFVVLLLSIAVLPVTFPEVWEKRYSAISFTLAAAIIAYYLVFEGSAVKVLHSLEEYFSFITLLFSLYIVSGGIFIKLRGKSTPLRNSILLLTGAFISNFFGTTGASMLLIRPYIETNKYRIKPYHIIFFIFIVSNIGGSLTPVGDPPLLIGFLKGIPFFWYAANIYHIWLFAILSLLTVFYIYDKYFYDKVKYAIQEEAEKDMERLTVEGKWNLVPLLIIVFSVLISQPKFLREIMMLLAAVISYRTTPDSVHTKNHFSFAPIKEVAVLFFGIFITMIPALSFVSENSVKFGLDRLENVYWYSGTLTSFLDNAPTFLNFLTGSMSSKNLSVDTPAMVLEFSKTYSKYLIAISVASVFFGAMTYIGNAPNFMVKSISENKGLKMPGFAEYIYKYSIIILLPLFIIIWFLFF